MSEEDLARALASSARTGEPFLTNAVSNELLHRVATLAHAIGTVNDGIIATDIDGRIQYLNPAAERSLGLTTEETRGRFADEILQAPAAHPGEPAIRNALRAGKTVRWAGATFQSPGGPVTVTAVVSPGRTETGMRGGIIVFHAPDTAPTRIQSEAHAHALALIALGSPILDVLETIGETLDAPPERFSAIVTLDPSGRKVSRVVAQSLPDSILRAIFENAGELATTGETNLARWREAWVGFGEQAQAFQPVRITPILDRHRELEGVILLCAPATASAALPADGALDVAAQLVDAALIRAHSDMCRSLVQSVLSSSADGICSIDREGKVTSWSRSADEIFQLPAVAAIGCDFHELFDESERELADEILEKVGRQEGPSRHVVLAPRQQGSPAHVALTINQMSDAHGVRVGATVIARPVPSPPRETPSEAPAHSPVPAGPHRGAPLPPDEEERLAVVAAYDLLDTPAEDVFDDLTRLASGVIGVPIALVSIVDRNRQWFKSEVGLGTDQTPREESFCAHAILAPDEPLVVVDAREDPRFANNPLVTGDLHLRAYAGIPLNTAAGQPLGTFCVLDKKPHVFNDEEMQWLRIIADQAIAQIELRRLSGRYAQALLARDRLRDEVAALKRQGSKPRGA